MLIEIVLASFMTCVDISTKDLITDDDIHVAVVQCAITTNYHGDIEEYIP